ncbi:MAG: hypothetical protein BMS9Abin33_1089 [Gammaproteobacteria bacterium]|nr:MAG: hypothetical protein BMS9Abin33_1089 [Gammaproteobacteria bacterium]
MNQLIQHTIRSVSLILTVLAALTLAACGNNGDSSGNDNSNPARNYMGTQAPGDVWSWTITTGSGGTGTFSASNDTLGYTYSGDVETLANGFLKLTITATTEPGLIPPAVAYALEFPDTALVIKPAGTTGNAIVAAALGPCPTASASYNWVDLLDFTWTTADQAYGVSATTVTGSSFDFSDTNYYLNGTVSGIDAVTGFTCSGGRLTHPTDPTVIVVTPSGVFIGDSGPGAGGFVGMQAPASLIDLSDVARVGREYRGFDFTDANTDPTRDDTTPIWGRSNGSGGSVDLIGGEWSDFEGNIEDPGTPGNIVFGTQASPGIVNATLTDGAGTTDMVLMINRINGKYFIYGAQVNTSTLNGSNFLAIEQ